MEDSRTTDLAHSKSLIDFFKVMASKSEDMEMILERLEVKVNTLVTRIDGPEQALEALHPSPEFHFPEAAPMIQEKYRRIFERMVDIENRLNQFV